MSNQQQNLGAVITSPVARRVIYGAYAVVGVIAAATTVGFASSETATIPEWLGIANAVIAFLGGPVGALAATNTPAASDA